MNNKYELVTIVNAHLAADAKESIYKHVNDAVVKGGGKVVNSHVWLEKHKLAFNIKKSGEATYHLTKFEGEGAVVDKINQLLRLNEEILRFAIIREEE
ncbi:MAG TPA: 30S ribosomal protein S6 [Candidatus Omnitrophota bacterium]|nr:30S ribosomal protein S6 [Candidatus Omnitrophota bacterium]HPD84309.1 30S ribosomal protein S6 [Candidatus Omnitrophota bacterium]HRZ03166.1 30S ribosomal protein S6 [Candidatus Omnitrophota bacterium]